MTVSAPEPRLFSHSYGTSVGRAANRRAVVISLIEDDGPGIPEADLERVVEPYVRLEASRSRETGGVGLGLAIARDAARLHGGELRLENRPEGGFRVTLILPRNVVVKMARAAGSLPAPKCQNDADGQSGDLDK